MAIFSPVVCSELHNTASESWSVSGRDCSVTLRCAWVNRFALIEDLLVNRRPWPYGSYANYPVATACGLAPLPSAGVADVQGYAYSDAHVNVSYSSAGEETTLISETLEPTAEFMQLDYKQFLWENGDSLLEGEAPGKIVRGMQLSRELFQVALPLDASILTLPGSVNHAAYASSLLGLTFAAETLMFTPPTLSRTITTLGSSAANISLKFVWNPEGWNTFWRAKTQAYSRMLDFSENPYNNYPLKDYSAWLF